MKDLYKIFFVKQFFINHLLKYRISSKPVISPNKVASSGIAIIFSLKIYWLCDDG